MYAIAGIVNVILTVVVDTEVVTSVAYGSLAAINGITKSIKLIIMDYIGLPLIKTTLFPVSVILSESGITIRDTHS